jgi:hypothetical protein
VPGVFKVFVLFAMAASMLLSMLAPVPLVAATRAAAAPAGPRDSRQAQAALRQLLAAYVAGRQADMEALVSPAMIGYAGVVDAARQARPLQKQLRVTLSDLRAQASEDAGAGAGAGPLGETFCPAARGRASPQKRRRRVHAAAHRQADGSCPG